MSAEQTTPAATPASKPVKAKRGPRRVFPMTAPQLAQDLSRQHKSTVTAKSVRQWVRDNVTAYQDDAYTRHQYDAAMVKRIEAAWTARKARSGAAKQGGK